MEVETVQLEEPSPKKKMLLEDIHKELRSTFIVKKKMRRLSLLLEQKINSLQNISEDIRCEAVLVRLFNLRKQTSALKYSN